MDRSRCPPPGLGRHLEPMEASARSQDGGQRDVRKSGKYRWHRRDWQLVTWETALPSCLEIKLPADFEQLVEAAKRTYHRFGQYAAGLDKIRSLIERKPVEKTEIERMFAAMKVPGDFDVAQISWRPDYDSFFYQQLSRRALRT